MGVEGQWLTTDKLIVHQEKAALYRLGQWLIDHRKAVAVVTYGFTAVMMFFAFRMEMFTEFGDLLPYRHPFVLVHTKFANQFGGANNITIMVEVKDGTIFNKDTLTKIFKMTQVIDILPGINHDQIDSIGHRSTRYMKFEGASIATPPVMRRVPKTDRDVDDVRNIVHYSDSLHGILVSLDDKAALIRANFFEGRVNYRQLFYDVDDKIIKPFQDANTTIWVAGEPRLYGWIYHYTSEVWWIFGACTIFMWILLYMYFHDWRGALRPTLTGVISAIWGLGVVKLIGFPMDPLSLVIPFFVTARAVSHSVQMHDRYYEEYHRHNWNKEQAIVSAFAELFEPTLSGIVTDALGMLVIVLVPVVILQRIAISASIWVAAIVLSELILNPIIYCYLKAPEKENVLSREEGPFQNFITWWSHLVVGPKGRWVSVVVWVGAFLLAFTQLKHITIGDATASTPLLQPDSPYNQAHTRIQKFFGGVEPLIIVVEGKEKGALKDPEAEDAMEAFQRYVDSDPEIGYSFSLADTIKSINMVFYDTQPRWGVIPEATGRIANLFFFYFAGAPPSETSKYLDPSYTMAHVTFFCRNHQGDTVARIIERCRDYVAEVPQQQGRLPAGGRPHRRDGGRQRGDPQERHLDELPRLRDDLLRPAVHVPVVRGRYPHARSAVPRQRRDQRLHRFPPPRHQPAVAAGGHGRRRVRHRLRPLHREPRDRRVPRPPQLRRGGPARNADRRQGGDVHRGVARGVDSGLGGFEHPLQFGDGAAALPVDDDQLHVDDDAAAGVDGHHPAEVHDAAGEARRGGSGEGRGDGYDPLSEGAKMQMEGDCSSSGVVLGLLGRTDASYLAND